MERTIRQRNNVKISGEGAKTIIFAHGFGCDQNMWRWTAPAFEKDYRVVLFDYVGSGQSDISKYDKDKYDSLQGYVQDVLDICDELQLEDAVFVGHSVSAMIGMMAAIERPESFDKLIMIGPSPCYMNKPPYFGGFEKEELHGLIDLLDKNYIGWAKGFAAMVMANEERPSLAQELMMSICSTDPVIARQFAIATFFSDYRHELQKVSVPALIIQCSDDMIAPAAVGEFVHLHIPNSTLKVMDAAGHCPHLSHPEKTVELIREYLEALM